MHAESLYVSVVGEGPEMYSLRSFALAKSFSLQEVKPYVMQVAIVNKGKWLVVGGDKGTLKVYSTATSAIDYALVYEKHSALPFSKKAPRVQVLAVSIIFQTTLS